MDLRTTLPALLAIGMATLPQAARADAASDVLYDPRSIWTWQDENSSITLSDLTDKFYTNGLRLGWTSPTDQVPTFLSDGVRDLFGPDGRQRISFDVQESIFTPSNTKVAVPDPSDRPYAGTLLGDLAVLQDTNTTRSIVGVQFGVVGPDAFGEQIQNGFHNIIGVFHARGWAYQISNEPVGEALAAREWRLPIAELGFLEADSVSTLEAGVGNLRDYALGGAIVRLGQGLTSDFGPARVRPGPTGMDAFTLTRPLAWYVFVGADGQAVGYDVTIDGKTANSINSAKLVPTVAEFEGGLAVLYDGFRLSYQQVFQTEEVRHQAGGLHEFSSLAISTHF